MIIARIQPPGTAESNSPIPLVLMPTVTLQVDNFQPLYVFNKKRHMGDLKIGAEIIRECFEREMTKEERAAQAKKEEKAVAAAQIANVGTRFV